MADNQQLLRKKEELSNDILKDVFQELHDTVVNNINTSSVIGKLFAAKVISTNHMQDLHCIKHPYKMCTQLLIILHKAENPRTFIELREAIATEDGYEWLVDKIDEKYNLMAPAAAQAKVTRVRSSLLMLLRDDNARLNVVIDDLRKDNVAVMSENTRLVEEIAKQKVDNERLSKANATLAKDISRLVVDNERLCLELSEYEKKMMGIVEEQKKELQSVRKNNPQLLCILYQPPKDRDGDPRKVMGVVMLDRYLYVVYAEYSKVRVFDYEDFFKKINDIHVEKIRSPHDMVGCSVTSQLFISDYYSDVIRRVDSKTAVSDVFVETGYRNIRLSLVENRLSVTLQDSLLMIDIVSGERIKTIPFTGDITRYGMFHAIESNRDSFFVSHGTSSSYNSTATVSEIDSEGRVIRVLDNKQQLDCHRLALDSVGRLLVADWDNKRVLLFDEHLTYIRVLIDNKRLDNAMPRRLNYNKNNNIVTVGLNNGHVRIFEY